MITLGLNCFSHLFSTSIRILRKPPVRKESHKKTHQRRETRIHGLPPRLASELDVNKEKRRKSQDSALYGSILRCRDQRELLESRRFLSAKASDHCCHSPRSIATMHCRIDGSVRGCQRCHQLCQHIWSSVQESWHRTLAGHS